MIEVDSCYPSDWSTWNSSSLQPYLELYGEAHPFICTNLTETLPAHSMNNNPEMKAVAPIYEYFWTIGISEYLCARFAQHSASLINTLAKVPITSLPPVEGLPWTLTKVTGYLDSEIRDGVQWTLPKKLFYVLGRRLTGSIAVYFHPAQSPQKQQETVSNNQLIVQTRPILAQAVVHGDGKRLPSIEKDGKEYIELDVTPRPIPQETKKQQHA